MELGRSEKKKSNKHIFTFRIDEPDDSEGDSDYSPDVAPGEDAGEHAGRGGRDRSSSSSRRAGKEKSKEQPASTSKDKAPEDEGDEQRPKRKRLQRGSQVTPSDVPLGGDGWGSGIPTELLERVFLYVIGKEDGMKAKRVFSRVCRHWRNVARLPSLLVTVNLTPWWASAEPKTGKGKAKAEEEEEKKIRGRLDQHNLAWTKRIMLKDCPLGDAFLEHLGDQARRLEFVDLSACHKFTAKGLLALVEKCPKLVGVHMFGCRHLSSNVAIQQLVLQVHKRGGSLEALGVSSTLGISQNFLKSVLQYCPNLRELSIHETSVGKVNIEELQAKCPDIRELDLSLCHLECPKERNEAQPPPGFPNLRILSLAGANLISAGDALLRFLRTSDKLEVLDIRTLPFFTRQTLERLPPFPSLRVFLMGACKDAAPGALEMALAKFGPGIEIFDGSWTKICDRLLALLVARCGATLRDMNLSGTVVSGDGIKALVLGCPQLERLSLESCRGAPREFRRVFDQAALAALRTELAH